MKNLILDKDCALLSFSDYEAADGFEALKKACNITPSEVIDQIKEANLRGRGGSGFSTGLKMSFVAEKKDPVKYIICNADEGEPGTFKDRELFNRNPLKVIEGMIIAAYAIGATKGYLYVRGEYANLKEIITSALNEAKNQGYLGQNVCGCGFNFDIEFRSGTGAYICGEETALIESIEGRSGDPRIKPPYVSDEGLWGKPTLVNNVETLANILPIINLGADAYKTIGTKKSPGTKLFSVSGCVRNRGVYEAPFGTTVRQLINGYCDGVEGDKQIKFVQIGGSSGIVLPASKLDVELSYEAFEEMGAGIGSGAVLVVDESVCVIDFLKSTAAFFKHESCGKCTPCREGNSHIVRILENISHGEGSEEDFETLLRTSRVMKEASFCGLGRTASTAVASMIEHFKNEMSEHLDGACLSGVCDVSQGGDR